MGAAEDLLEELRTGGYARVLQFISDQQPEGLHLDFKKKQSANKAQLEADDLKNYAKALSGFANSDGGVIVWGVVDQPQSPEDPDVAIGVSQITNHVAFATNLNSVASQLVSRAVEGVVNLPIADPSDSTKGVVASLIPASDFAPHRAEGKEKHYFKRNVSSFYRMEHFELEDMFGRRRRPSLDIAWQASGRFTQAGEAYRIQVLLDVTNVGKHPAQNVAVQMEGRFPSWRAGPNSEVVGTRVFAIPNGRILYPGTTARIAVSDDQRPVKPPWSEPLAICGTLYAVDMAAKPFAWRLGRAELKLRGCPDLPIEFF